jgi:hypothetical protein
VAPQCGDRIDASGAKGWQDCRCHGCQEQHHHSREECGCIDRPDAEERSG